MPGFFVTIITKLKRFYGCCPVMMWWLLTPGYELVVCRRNEKRKTNQRGGVYQGEYHSNTCYDFHVFTPFL